MIIDHKPLQIDMTNGTDCKSYVSIIGVPLMDTSLIINAAGTGRICQQPTTRLLTNCLCKAESEIRLLTHVSRFIRRLLRKTARKAAVVKRRCLLSRELR